MSTRPRLLDLFCGAGGAAMGYARAGFDVVGVDIAPQPHYPFAFIQADALTFPLEGYDVIHASPPCQGYSRAGHIKSPNVRNHDHPRLIPTIRDRLVCAGVPWVIENVGGAPMAHYLTLCGTSFDLRVYRHRQFESSDLIFSAGSCSHPSYLLPGYVGVYAPGARGRQTGNKGNQYERYGIAYAREAMGIPWMTLAELSQAIPPAYTEWIGRQLLEIVRYAA